MGFGPGVSESYGYGQQIHNILAEVNKAATDGVYMTADEVSGLVEKRFHLRYTRDGTTFTPLTLLKNAAKKSLQRYLERFPDATRYVLEAEKPFEFVDKDSGALISGTVDLLERIDSSNGGTHRIPVAVVDFKTHKWKSADTFFQRKHEVETQLRLYALAVGQSFAFDASKGLAHFLSPHAPSPELVHQGVEETIEVDVSETEQRRTRNLIKQAVDGIQTSLMSGTHFARKGPVSGHCENCDFRVICPGYKDWDRTNRTKPRPPSPENSREDELRLVEEEGDAGSSSQ